MLKFGSATRKYARLTWFVICLCASASLVQPRDSEVMAKEAHDREMEQLRQEIQQCKDFIHTQQQLLQVSMANTRRLAPVGQRLVEESTI